MWTPLREVVEQVLYLQSVADASWLAETSPDIRDEVKAHWQEAVEEAQARVDRLIAELPVAERHQLQRLAEIITDRTRAIRVPGEAVVTEVEG